MASAADLELLWTHIEVEIDLPHAPSRPTAVRGVSRLWVLPTNLKPRKHLRIHCRQCKVTGVTINGIPATSWECLDPHDCIVRSPDLIGNGEALETFSRAAFLAAQDGELAIRLPALGPTSQPTQAFRLPDEIAHTAQQGPINSTSMDTGHSRSSVGAGSGNFVSAESSSGLGPSQSTSSSMPARAAESRARCLSAMRARLAACAGSHGKPLLIEVTYELEDPKGGFECTWPNCSSSSGGGVLMHTCGGGGFGSTTGVDLDGARCRWPCLDGPAGTHQAPVELMVNADAKHACVASGQRLMSTVEGGEADEGAPASSQQGSSAANAVAVPPWVQARVGAAATVTSPLSTLLAPEPLHPWPLAFRRHAWFVGPHCPMRGVGLVLGTALVRLPSPPPPLPPQPPSSSSSSSSSSHPPCIVTPPPLDVWVSQSANENDYDDKGDVITTTTAMRDAAHATNGLAAACLFCGDVLGTGGEFPEPCHTQVWLPTLQQDDTLVFANLTLVSRRLLHGSTVAEPQLPGHLLQLRALLLAYLLPLVKLNTVASDGWLLAGISGWLVLRWAERALGDDHHRLMLLRLHDAVVRREARLPDMAPISRGGAYARLHASSSTAGVDVRAWETSADESLLGLAATEDPLLIGAKSLKAEERAHWHAKSTLVMHMLEQRLGADGRDSLLRAIHMSLLPGLDLLAAPPGCDHIQPPPLAGPLPPSLEEEEKTSDTIANANANTTATTTVPGGSEVLHVEWAQSLDTLGFFALATDTPGSSSGSGGGGALSLLSSGGGAGDAFGGWMEQWVRCSGAALLKVNWEYNKSKHEIDLTIEQVVPPWRTHSTSSSSSSGEGGGSGSLNSDAATAGHANHQGCFQGLLQIRIVEVDDLVVDHQRVIGSETQYTFTFKCQTNKSRMRKRPTSSSSSGDLGGSSSGDDGSGECPVLWIKVDPDYAWMRELVMKQPFDSWLEQLGRDGDADAQVLSLRAIAELPLAGESTKVPHAKPAAALADVVRGVPLPLPSAWLMQQGSYYNSYSHMYGGGSGGSGGGGVGYGGSASEAHAWGVRVEAADALARWQAMHAPRSGVASLAGSWRGRDMLRQCLLDLFTDVHTATPMPLGCRVVRAINNSSSSESSSVGGGGGALSRGAFATSALHVGVLEGIATCRAQNGASSLAGARTLLDTLGYADDDHDEQPILTSAGECSTTGAGGASGNSAGGGSAVVGFWKKEKKKRKKEGGGNSSTTCSTNTSSARSLDKSYALARLLGCLGEVFLRQDEVNQEVETWRLAAQAQAQRLFYADTYRGSHLGVVRAAALQALGALSLLATHSTSSSSSSTSSTGNAAGAKLTASNSSSSGAASSNSASSTVTGRDSSSSSSSSAAAKDWYLKAWSGTDQPDLVRLVAIVGTVQQHTSSGQASLAVEALRWALRLLFNDGVGGGGDVNGGEHGSVGPVGGAPNNPGGTTTATGRGVDNKRKRSTAATPGSSSSSSTSLPSPSSACSKWLQVNAIEALDEWAKGGWSIEPGGVLAGQDLLFGDQRLPGLTGGPCPAWKAWYAPDAARLPPSPRPKQLAKLFRDLLRGACGYPVREPIAKDHAHLQPQQPLGAEAADASSPHAAPTTPNAVHSASSSVPSSAGGSSVGTGLHGAGSSRSGGITAKQQLRLDARHLCLKLWQLVNGSHPDVVHNTPLRVALQHLWTTLLGQDVPPVVGLNHHQACDPRSLVGGLDGTLLFPTSRDTQMLGGGRGTTGTVTTGEGGAASAGAELAPVAWVQPFRLRNQVPAWASPESGLEGIYQHVRAQRLKRLPQANWVEEARSAAAAHALALAEGAAAAAAAAKKARPEEKRIIRFKNSAPAPTPSTTGNSSSSGAP